MKKRIFAAIIAAVFVVLNIASALPAIALDESTTKYEKAESNVSETVETKGVLMGDADQNGVIAINDALIIMRTALRLENREPESCDVNGDGLLTMADALLILRVSLHLSEEFYRIEYLT
ncbi:MAG: hypothetical protein II747_04260, partial [Clostridia bacterium]|nr:hypothetical protein [Clostridia bacterium]